MKKNSKIIDKLLDLQDLITQETMRLIDLGDYQGVKSMIYCFIMIDKAITKIDKNEGGKNNG